jgi:hypothetical protein
MVKNFSGGNKAKSFARKNASQMKSPIVLPTNSLEQFAVVSKMVGNGICYVFTQTHPHLIAHIRKKFSGRFKKDNLIQMGTILLIGLREWESTAKNCDVLEVYNHSDLSIIKTHPAFSFTDDMLNSFSRNQVSTVSKEESIIFDENAEDDDFKDISNEIISINNDFQEEINIDDI